MCALYGWDVRIAASAIKDDLGALGIPSSRPLSIVSQWAQSSQPTETQHELLDALSHLVVEPNLTIVVARHARPILIDLFLRAIERLGTEHALWTDWSTAKCLYALTLLLRHCSELQPLVLELLKSTPPTPDSPLSNTPEHATVLLLSMYRLLLVSPITIDEAGTIIPSSQLLTVARAKDHCHSSVRLLALRVLARLENLSESTLDSLIAQYVGTPGIRNRQNDLYVEGDIFVRIPSTFSQHELVQVEHLDAWVLPIQENRRSTALQSQLLIDSNRESDCVEPFVLQQSAFRPRIVSFGGFLFLRSEKPTQQASTFRETDALGPVLQDLAQKVRRGLPVLVSGPEACGKTSLVRHACAQISNDKSKASIVWLQLGDQSGIDAKSLVGSFVSSTKRPGTFEWVEGALTRSVRLGKWVVLEDIDKANSEILSIVKPLVEGMAATSAIGARPYLDLAHRGRVPAGQGFALFATRTVTLQQYGTVMLAPTFMGNHCWSEVQMNVLQTSDVVEIVAATNPQLAHAQDNTIDRLVSTWAALNNVARNPKSIRPTGTSNLVLASAGTQRVPSLHDLLKWCRRIDAIIARSNVSTAQAPFSNQALQEEIALEAVDIFLGASPPPVTDADVQDRASNMIGILGDQLGVEASALRHMARDRKPELSLASLGTSDQAKAVQIGRCHLERFRRNASSSLALSPPSTTFALTGTAARLLERIAVCVSQNEPALIVGETGTGKTTVVQQLASILRKPLVALNLSQQTESADLLGGFKPLDPQIPAMELHNIWLDLFQRTFSLRRNARYLQAERKALQAHKWIRLHGTWKDSVRLAFNKLKRGNDVTEEAKDSESGSENEGPARKLKRTTRVGDRQETRQSSMEDAEEIQMDLHAQWTSFNQQLLRFSQQYMGTKRTLVFSFVEGPLVKAIREGAWVLLDEINLATSETLECLCALLQTPDSSIVLSERGDLEPIARHPDFRLFACMNPATDVGKKDLPNSLRSRFTELYAPSPDTDREALINIVEKYIASESAGDRGVIVDAAQCFIEIKKLAREQKLADGANQRPHYSIRSLARALMFAKDTCEIYGIRRSLYEGFLMAFTMLLDNQSGVVVRQLLERHILTRAKNEKQAFSFVPPKPNSSSKASHVQIGPFWLEAGSQPLEDVSEYILTKSVQDKLVGLARATLTRRSPVLIQGPTSAGKTSAVEYLARRTGHRFVRINNHEHTDLQEYLGSYSTDVHTGKLVFQEGLLVTAARKGEWIVLDELNLAPTDVLEALNRLLDDNRELQIPETGEVVTPHPHFMLFATQNPPGLYAGRKVLSRAFRNRFLEIHFDDVPQAELQTILANRCRVAPSYADKIVRVFLELQRRRQQTRVFDTKQAFVTLRDLFRWGLRDADDYHQLAINGYILIAERTRKAEEAAIVKEVIEETLKVKIDVQGLYDVSTDSPSIKALLGSKLAVTLSKAMTDASIVWTRPMKRLAVLVACAFRYNEPVLLVGETGTGKTSICEVVASAFLQSLRTINCHQNTDAADLLGGQRPLRNRSVVKESARANGWVLLQQLGGVDSQDPVQNDAEAIAMSLARLESPNDEAMRRELQDARTRITQSLALFEWNDGPLVEAMRKGQHFLLDEISLADDSVLERLNSVLEPGRTLVLAERGGAATDDTSIIRAHDTFQIVATMNPGGDYGKKELSPALRNRFTEIWVPSISDKNDIVAIVNEQWDCADATDVETLQNFGCRMVDFAEYYNQQIGGADATHVGLRDMISWTRFMNAAVGQNNLSLPHAFMHGALMTLLDGLPLHPWVVAKPAGQVKALLKQMMAQATRISGLRAFDEHDSLQITDTTDKFAVGGFSCTKGHLMSKAQSASPAFNLVARTPAQNALRVLRAMQVKGRAIMLEGSPGAGKTSLIVALARACRHRLTRINLSDQTELSDLFGADLPIEGGKPGEFGWREAGFLKAMQEGSWVLLDEMNLASQSVLEGLNSCLDHRGEVYIPELDKTFTKHPDFRFFAAQNPQHQGGGRKGLPKSFLNRFTKVYIEELDQDDFIAIMSDLYPSFPRIQLENVVQFNNRLQIMLRSPTNELSKFGFPWEFNLRDLLRWLEICFGSLGLVTSERKMNPVEYLSSMYIMRFRTHQDRTKVAQLAHETFGRTVAQHVLARPWLQITPTYVQVGHTLLQRQGSPAQHLRDLHATHGFAKEHLNVLQALGECVQLGWPSIIVGKGGSGKTSLVRSMAKLMGQTLTEVRMNSGTDAVDIIGGFEQVDVRGKIVDSLSELSLLIQRGKHHAFASGTLGEHLLATLLIMSNEVDRERTAVGQSETLDVNWQMIVQVATDVLSQDILTQQDRKIGQQLLDTFLEMSSTFSVAGDAGSRFAWQDGPVLTALRQGHWLLLDEANLCSASVLDRLNSLLEPGGNLVLSERGVVPTGRIGEPSAIEIVWPHPNFRVFIAMDPKYGELSRAMRNRGMEVFLDDFQSNETGAESSAFATSEASMQSIALWERTLSTLGDGDDVKTHASMGLVERALNVSAVGLLSRLDTASTLASFELLPTDSSRVRHLSDEVKTKSSNDDELSPTFLSQLGPDLQTNPALTSSTVTTQQHLLSLQLQIATRASSALYDLRRFQGSVDASQVAESTVLQRSALITLGFELDNVSQEDRQAFILLWTIAQGTLNALHGFALTNTTQDTIDTLDKLQTVHDCAYFLKRVWTLSRRDVVGVSRLVLKKLTDHIGDVSLRYPKDMFASVIDALRSAARYVDLKSGYAMEQVWRAFIPYRATTVALALSRKVFATIDSNRQRLSQDLIANGMDIAYLLAFQSARDINGAELDDLLSLGERMYSALQQSTSSAVNDERQSHYDRCDSLLVSFAVLSALTSSQARRSLPTAKVVESSKSTSDLEAALSLRALSHSTQSSPKGLMLYHGTFAWIGEMFNASLAGNDANGARQADTQDAFRPSTLLSVMDLCMPSNRITLAQWDHQQQALARMAEVVGVLAPAELSLRRAQCVEFAKKLVTSLNIPLRLALQQAYEKPTDTQKSLLASVDGATDPGLSDALRSLLHSSEINVQAKSLAHDWLRCLTEVEQLSDARAGQEAGETHESLNEAGSAFVKIANCMLRLYVTNIPIDPLQTNQVEIDLIDVQIERLRAEQAAILTIESLTTGNAQTRSSDEVEERVTALLNVKQKAASASSRHLTGPERKNTDVDILHQMHAEMLAFVTQIFPESTVERLISSSPSVGNMSAYLSELQVTTLSVHRRFSMRYQSLRDLTSPFVAALSMIHLGLGMLRHAQSLASRSPTVVRTDMMLNALVSFPTSAATLHFTNQEIPLRLKASSNMASVVVPLLIAKAKAIYYDVTQGRKSVFAVASLAQCYDQVWHFWTLDKEQEKQRKEEEASLYRMRNLDINVEEDAELQEREFALLFPQYKDILEEEQEPPPLNVNGDSSHKTKKAFVNDEDVKQLFFLHLSLFCPQTLAEWTENSFVTESFKSSRNEIVRRLLRVNYAGLGEQLDKSSSALQHRLLNDALRKAEVEEMHKQADFYVDADYEEAEKLRGVIFRVQARLAVLIADWPDQHVLQDLMQRCEAILRLDIRSPLNRLLAALEGLLTHTEDWQNYASSKTSLQAQREEITALIIEWRRKELHGWRKLLIKEQFSAFEKAKDWWFTLFQVTTKSASEEAGERRELVELLDKFMRGSPLGQFSARLGLLKAMHSFHTQLCKHLSPSESQKKVQAIVVNTCDFFAQFEHNIVEHLVKKRHVIEREIADFVKLASWKDTNVHALKTSAQKTHRKLHQCLRKFRVVLNEGVDPLLANIGPLKDSPKTPVNGTSGQPERRTVGVALSDSYATSQSWHDDATPGHLNNLTRTVGTLQQIFARDVRPALGKTDLFYGLSDLSLTIKERSQELAKATPAFSSDKNEKLVKHLETRKRKAWSDLLKELRRIGLSTSHVDGLSSKSLSDSAFVLSLDGSGLTLLGGNGERAGKLHNQLLAMLPLLRGAIVSQTRNPDVQVSQLQLGLGYIENGFLISLATRSRLRDILHNLTTFHAIFDRNQALLQTDKIHVVQGTVNSVKAVLQENVEFWNRIVSGLRETCSEARRQGVSAASYQQTLEDLTKDARSCNEDFERLHKWVDQSSSTMISDAEEKKVEHADDVFDRMVESLVDIINNVPEWRSMTIPLLDFVKSSRPSTALAMRPTHGSARPTAGAKSDAAISSLLVVMQDIRKLSQSEEVRHSGDDGLFDRAVVKEIVRISAFQQSLRPDEVRAALQQTHELDSDDEAVDPAQIVSALSRLQPFLDVYVGMLDDLAARAMASYVGLMDLNVTLCNLITSLASKGFCKPRAPEQNQENADDAQDGEQIETGGVGLGEGEGVEDVTNTLKDDEDMEELQQDKDEEQRGANEEDDQETKREKDAREMEQDFDGEMESAEAQDDQEGQEDAEEEAEIDDAVGDVDPLDPNAVDEKTWAGKDEEESHERDDGKDEKEMEGEENAQSRDGEERQGAKESSKKNEGDEGAGERQDNQERGENKGDEEEAEGEGEKGKDNDGEDDGSEEQDIDDDEVKQDGLGRAIDPEAQQGENLDLNIDEDLNMDNEGDDMEGENDSDMDDVDALSDAGKEEIHQDLSPDPDPENSDEDAAEQGEAEEVKDADGPPETAQTEEEDESKPEVGRDPGEEGADEEDESDGRGIADSAEQPDDGMQDVDPMSSEQGAFDAQADSEAAQAEAMNDGPAQQQQSSRAQSGRERRGADQQPQSTSAKDDRSQVQKEMMEAEEAASEEQHGGGSSRQEQAKDANAEVDQESQDQDDGERSARSLGDALKQFRRDLDAIEERLAQERQQQPQDQAGPTADDEADQVEHILNDEDSEMQALGVAQEEEAKQRKDDVTSALDADAKADENDVEAPLQQLDAPEPPAGSERDMLPSAEMTEQDVADKESVKPPGRGLMASDLRRDDDNARQEGFDAQMDDETFDDQDEELHFDESIAEDAKIDAVMQDFASEADEEKRLEAATALWRLFTSATTDYAFTLSEQLRLILTPTKATKLSGDFKTGKRLNMRKIIPFIASDYVKDKIWLRRDQPQKREYQVLICIDDSKSMCDSENRSLAFKSLALVCNALDRLEVGQVGVMKFGKQAELLKGFDGGADTVGDVQGARIFSRLPFDQRGTNMAQLLRQSFDVLTDARERHGNRSSSNGTQELWQLQIIISDGVCQDHEGLRALLRRASENRIMVVFVILDSLQQQQQQPRTANGGGGSSSSSILTMSSAEYRPDASGRLQLQMKRYLDTFPFDYFVVVQDATELPDVLSTTLRQWAQRIAEA